MLELVVIISAQLVELHRELPVVFVLLVHRHVVQLNFEILERGLRLQQRLRVPVLVDDAILWCQLILRQHLQRLELLRVVRVVGMQVVKQHVLNQLALRNYLRLQELLVPLDYDLVVYLHQQWAHLVERYFISLVHLDQLLGLPVKLQRLFQLQDIIESDVLNCRLICPAQPVYGSVLPNV